MTQLNTRKKNKIANQIGIPNSITKQYQVLGYLASYGAVQRQVHHILLTTRSLDIRLGTKKTGW